ncbi:hypothetical protein OPT61_g6492 [Boeremia exigua]|uniref:Uncharacterized protein n=1 Tax=Boeremia exigua TaxID=749465 RepID=A0ACC2I6G3_9PLEO|nr:hypothetical protein OPT61_g6492 [Boeremia exigua]
MDDDNIFKTPYDTINGSFIFPRVWPLTFREGSSINISWSTEYKDIDLYYYQQIKNAASVQLVTNLAANWYQWDVRSEAKDLSEPFVFRIVNARGTPKGRSIGGFYSTSWYLTRDDDASQSATSSPSTKFSHHLTVSSKATTTSASPPPTTTSIEIRLLSSTSHDLPAEATVASTSEAATHVSAVDRTTIIGLIVGIVMAGAIIILGVWYPLKTRRMRKAMVSSPVLPPSVSCHGLKSLREQINPYYAPEVQVRSLELQNVAPCYELPDKAYDR